MNWDTKLEIFLERGQNPHRGNKFSLKEMPNFALWSSTIFYRLSKNVYHSNIQQFKIKYKLTCLYILIPHPQGRRFNLIKGSHISSIIWNKTHDETILNNSNLVAVKSQLLATNMNQEIDMKIDWNNGYLLSKPLWIKWLS